MRRGRRGPRVQNLALRTTQQSQTGNESRSRARRILAGVLTRMLKGSSIVEADIPVCTLRPDCCVSIRIQFAAHRGRRSPENHHPAHHFKYLHDFRLVWPPEVPHLRSLEGDPRDWGIAFFEYCLQVPANRIGSYEFSAAQLKTIQEVITLSVFSVFSVLYLGEKIKWNYAAGFGCIALAVFFVFHKW